MPKLKEVCSYVRSKTAGPFWITVDVFFGDEAVYQKYRDSQTLGGESIAKVYGCNAADVKSMPVDNLHMVKVSYPRPKPQGWMGERDMHGGQQFVRLLDLEMA